MPKLRVKRLVQGGQDIRVVTGHKGGNLVKSPGASVRFAYDPNNSPNNPNVATRSFTVTFYKVDDDDDQLGGGNPNVGYWPFQQPPTVGSNGFRVDAASSPVNLTFLSSAADCKYEVESPAVDTWPAAEKLDPTVIISPGRNSTKPSTIALAAAIGGAVGAFLGVLVAVLGLQNFH